jgi:hypothetical protein
MTRDSVCSGARTALNSGDVGPDTLAEGRSGNVGVGEILAVSIAVFAKSSLSSPIAMKGDVGCLSVGRPLLGGEPCALGGD